MKCDVKFDVLLAYTMHKYVNFTKLDNIENAINYRNVRVYMKTLSDFIFLPPSTAPNGKNQYISTLHNYYITHRILMLKTFIFVNFML